MHLTQGKKVLKNYRELISCVFMLHEAAECDVHRVSYIPLPYSVGYTFRKCRKSGIKELKITLL